MSAQIAIEADAITVREVRPLFRPFMVSLEDNYDVAADGQRFLALVPPTQALPPPLVLLQNWTQLLNR